MRVGPGEALLFTENRTGKLAEATIDGDKATLRVIKDGFGQQPTAVAVVGDIAWVAEAKLLLREDPNKDPDPWLIVPVALH
jgi:hypothetical protein